MSCRRRSGYSRLVHRLTACWGILKWPSLGEFGWPPGFEHATAFLVVGTAASILGIGRFYLYVKQSETIKIDLDFESALGFLSSRPKATVMCVPSLWYDVVAYKTGLPVLYGGHGYGFKMLEPTYPRLLISVDELIRRFNLRYILFESGAVTEKFIADIPAHSAQDFGKYRVISIDVPEKQSSAFSAPSGA